MKNRLFVVLFLSQLSLFANAEIFIKDAWVRAAPPNTPALAAFMKIHNASNEDVKLLSAHTDGYARVELHRTIKQDDVMKMVKQEFMPIAPHKTLTLKPGSWHIMLIKPESVPKKDEIVMLTLNFSDGSEQTVSAVVKKGKKMMHKMMHH